MIIKYYPTERRGAFFKNIDLTAAISARMEQVNWRISHVEIHGIERLRVMNLVILLLLCALREVKRLSMELWGLVI